MSTLERDSDCLAIGLDACCGTLFLSISLPLEFSVLFRSLLDDSTLVIGGVRFERECSSFPSLEFWVSSPSAVLAILPHLFALKSLSVFLL